MIYVYASDDGEVIEVERSMHNAPKIGHKMKRRGKTFIRLPPNVRFHMSHDGHLESIALPPKWPYANKWAPDGSPRFDTLGEIKSCYAKARDHGEDVHWD